jgi:hypothetical protein
MERPATLAKSMAIIDCSDYIHRYHHPFHLILAGTGIHSSYTTTSTDDTSAGDAIRGRSGRA